MKITDNRSSAQRVRAPEGSGNIVVARGATDVRRAVAAMAVPQSVTSALNLGRAGAVGTDMAEANRMRLARVTSMRRHGMGDINFATQRPRDIEFYWRQNNLPYDTDKPDDLAKLRMLCRVLRRTHPLIGSAIDIFAKWPLVGMDFDCKDEEIAEFHRTLFFDQLDYEEFLPDVGTEYWTVGEVWPLGSWNEDLGVWEADELINPDDVFVEKSPFLRDPRFYIRLPESLRKILRTGQPAHEYEALVRSYPELLHFTGDNARMPVSNHLLKQLRFKGDTFNHRGVPLLLRGLRPLIQEEMLNAAQDAISDRLSTPLVLVKIGATASDLGTANPWVPTADQIGDFEASMDAALAADVRVMTTHFAVNVESVFGKETMPNFDADFERLAEKQLQVFGMSKTMLSGAGSGETYAADALNRDLISQLLSTYQRYVKRFVKSRAEVVAEAQGHYDYEMRGGRKYPVMEEVLLVDEDGEKHVEQRPKLLVPDFKLRTMNMADEENERQFLSALRAEGVPISIKSRMVNVDIDLKDEIEASRREQVDLAVENQVTRRETYSRLRDLNLPIPADLMADFGPKALTDGKKADPAAAEPTRTPQMGVDDPTAPALAPTDQDLMTPPGQPLTPATTPAEQAADDGAAKVIPLPTNHAIPSAIPGRTRPPESDEMRATMPKPATRVKTGSDASGQDTYADFDRGLVAGPRHIGMRRALDPDLPLDEQG